MGKKPVMNDAKAWKEHYERLLNVEFPWNPEDLSVESPVEGSQRPSARWFLSEGRIPSSRQESFNVNLYKGKENALNRGNYRGLKLIEQMKKTL